MFGNKAQDDPTTGLDMNIIMQGSFSYIVFGWMVFIECILKYILYILNVFYNNSLIGNIRGNQEFRVGKLWDLHMAP